MASLLGQFFTSIKGSQEDIASKGLAYILEKSNSAKNVINDIIKNKTNLTFENIKYITQSIGKNKERPDISGIDTQGNEKIIIEAKFWSSLTGNQPVEYLRRLKEQTVLIFICPKLRELSLLCEIEIKMQYSNIAYNKNNNGFEVEEKKYIFVIDWQYILEMIKQTLTENNEIKLVSDIDQIIGFCEIIDNNTFLPIQDYDLSPSIARRIGSYYDLIDKIYDKLQKEIKAYKGTLKATGQRFGYTQYFMINEYCITLELHFSFWQKIADTPFWIAIRPEWSKPQPIDFRDKLKKLSAKTNIKIYENDFNDLLYFALKPKLNEIEDVVVTDIANQIIMIMNEL
jgi:hypothetical protein